MNFLCVISVSLLMAMPLYGFNQNDPKIMNFLKTKQGSGLDLTGADLSHASLDGAQLEGAILNAADLSYTSLQRANLKNVHAQGSNFCYTNMTGADLSDADFSDAKEAEEKTTSSADESKRKPRTRDAGTSKKNVQGSVGKRTSMSYAKLTNANLQGTNFAYADLNYVDFGNTQWKPLYKGLKGATIVHANFKGAKGPYDPTGVIDYQTSMVAVQQK